MLVWLAFESVIPAVVVVVVVASIVATVVATVFVVVVADVSILGGTEGVPNSVDIAFTSLPLPNVLRFVSFNLSSTEGLGLYIYMYNKTGRTIIRAKRYTLIGSVCI